jgi:hypothetical protein
MNSQRARPRLQADDPAFLIVFGLVDLAASTPLIENVNGCGRPTGSPIRYPHDKSGAHY